MNMIKTRKLTHAVLGVLLATSMSFVPAVGDAAKKTNEVKPESASQVYTRPEVVTDATQALELLKQGNARYMTGKALSKDISKERRTNLSQFGQKPFAVIVSCSDSRIPPELIFDQALGDLFVIRVAGNVVDTIEMGSVEYAVEHLGTPLVIVMGHDKCGAVKASLDGGEVTENIAAIAGKIQPAINDVKSGHSHHLPGNNLYEAVTDENVDKVVETLMNNPIIHHLMAEKKLQVIGAKYTQESGEVKFFETGHGH